MPCRPPSCPLSARPSALPSAQGQGQVSRGRRPRVAARADKGGSKQAFPLLGRSFHCGRDSPTRLYQVGDSRGAGAAEPMEHRASAQVLPVRLRGPSPSLRGQIPNLVSLSCMLYEIKWVFSFRIRCNVASGVLRLSFDWSLVRKAESSCQLPVKNPGKPESALKPSHSYTILAPVAIVSVLDSRPPQASRASLYSCSGTSPGRRQV